MVITDCALQFQPEDIGRAIKIGEGKYREVFRVDNYALKILKPCLRKSYALFNVDFNSSLYTKYKFGIKDFNQFEYNMFRNFIKKVPSELRSRFARIHSVGKINNRSYSLSDIITNEDGSLSKTLTQYGKLDNYDFWLQIDELERVLIDKTIPIMDIRGENIMVQKVNKKITPVFIDFKRYGGKTYPVQIWLSSEKQLIRKMQRRFQRLRELYQLS